MYDRLPHNFCRSNFILDVCQFKNMVELTFTLSKLEAHVYETNLENTPRSSVIIQNQAKIREQNIVRPKFNLNVVWVWLTFVYHFLTYHKYQKLFYHKNTVVVHKVWLHLISPDLTEEIIQARMGSFLYHRLNVILQ